MRFTPSKFKANQINRLKSIRRYFVGDWDDFLRRVKNGDSFEIFIILFIVLFLWFLFLVSLIDMKNKDLAEIQKTKQEYKIQHYKFLRAEYFIMLDKKPILH